MTGVSRWKCNKHGSEQVGPEECSGCVRDFTERQDAKTMTGDERAAEMRRWGSQLTVEFGKVHQRIEELVGRSVYTHEMAGQELWDALVEEARTQQHIGFADVLAQLPWGKPGLVGGPTAGVVDVLP